MVESIRDISAALQAPAKPSSDFDLNPGAGPGSQALRSAAVLVLLRSDDRELTLVLTKRSSGLKHHPGQIAFPGGKMEFAESAVDTALREAKEEIGVDRENVEILGELGSHETVTGFSVTPIVGVLSGPFEPVPELGEVEEIFEVPLRSVIDSSRFSIQGRIWQGSERKYFTIPYGPHYIWGATARILRGLADRLGT